METRALLNLLPQLRPVASYFRGVGGDVSGPLPGHLLCFARLGGKALGNRASRSSHHRHVVILALEGEGTVCVDAANYRLHPGEAMVLLPYQYHTYTEVTEELSWLFLTFEAARDRWAELGNRVHRLAPLDLALAYETALCWQEPEREGLMAWHVGLLMERLGAQPGARRRKAAEPDLLVRVNEYALARLGQMLSVSEVAMALGLSESHLRAEFRRLTGLPLGGHLRHLRLQRACALLHTTEEPITQVAEACGFDSVYSFSRAFKAVHQISPREYRRLRHF